MIRRIRELLTTDVVKLPREESIAEDDATYESLRKALELYAIAAIDESMDPGQFVRGVTKVVKMNMNLSAFKTIYAARVALKRRLGEISLELKSASG